MIIVCLCTVHRVRCMGERACVCAIEAPACIDFAFTIGDCAAFNTQHALQPSPLSWSLYTSIVMLIHNVRGCDAIPSTLGTRGAHKQSVFAQNDTKNTPDEFRIQLRVGWHPLTLAMGGCG